MKKLFKLATLITAIIALIGCAEDANEKGKDKPKKASEDFSYEEKVIYGNDNRQDLYQVTDSTLLKLADSTVALIESSKIKLGANNNYDINVPTFGQVYGLCPGEPYFDQVSAAFCSGFLVGKNLIATAGHCIRNASACSDAHIVFGYAVNAAGVNPTKISSSEVYRCKKIVQSEASGLGRDFAVIELDRNVVGHAPLKVRRTGTISVGEEVLVIGHPVGLPTKIADGARVRKLATAYFVANLDTYGGNSGSAVFNKATGDVEGILVRGENDFVTLNNRCNVSYRCADDTCRGEDATKITEALKYIPEVTNTNGSKSRVYASATKLNIPDKNLLGVTSSVITNEAPLGRKVYVEVNITHSWRGDLYVALVSPDGVEHVLANRTGRGNQNIIGVFGKDPNLPVDLSKAAAVNRAGVWTLRVSDRELRDIGTLNSWSLIFE